MIKCLEKPVSRVFCLKVIRANQHWIIFTLWAEKNTEKDKEDRWVGQRERTERRENSRRRGRERKYDNNGENFSPFLRPLTFSQLPRTQDGFSESLRGTREF